MTSALIPFSDVQTKLKEKVQGAMVDLIPDEAWDEFIKKAWASFTESTLETGRNGYHGHTPARDAELLTMIKSEMRAVLKAKVSTWAEVWSNSAEADETAQASIEAVAEAAGRGLLEGLKRNIIQDALMSMQLESSQRCQNCNTIGVAPYTNCSQCGQYNQQ